MRFPLSGKIKMPAKPLTDIMLLNKCALVITSSVHVSAPNTSLTDPQQREMQYLDSISFFIRESPVTKIIVCDNSGYRYPESVYSMAALHHKEIELLSFNGNNQLVALYGKGYGEGEILEFVLSNSVLIKQVEGFLKVTGRFKLVNIATLLQHANHWENYFMPVSLLRPRWMVPRAARRCVDVRVYYVTTAFFREVLLTAYRKVADKDVYFLEHAYHDAIAHQPARVKCFDTAPEMTGISGSGGWVLKERSRWKKGLVKFVFFLGYIRPVYRATK